MTELQKMQHRQELIEPAADRLATEVQLPSIYNHKFMYIYVCMRVMQVMVYSHLKCKQMLCLHFELSATVVKYD
jgi:hypothetical protein